MRIRWTRDAQADLIDILDHAGARNAREASNIAARIRKTEQAIEIFPQSALYNAAEDYYERYVPRTRVILIYRLAADEAVILAAFHTSRNPRSKP